MEEYYSFTQSQKARFAYKTLQFICVNIESMRIKKILENAIQLCDDFYTKNSNVADELYETLDNEEDGFTIIQECEENEDIQLILVQRIFNKYPIYNH